MEYACPFGQCTREKDERNTSEDTYEREMAKYQEYVRKSQEAQKKEAKLTVMAVSSMGSIHDKSLKAIKNVHGGKKTELSKSGER